MGYTVEERPQGRRPSAGDKPANEVPYLIVGDDPAVDDSEEAAIAAMAAAAPATMGVLKQVGGDVERLLPGFFTGSLKYGTGSDASQKETGESSFSFDTTGGTLKLTQSKQTVGRYPAGSGGAPDLKGVIGASADEVPAGVEVTIPQYAFSETHYIADEHVTNTYKGMLYALTGTVNNAAFKGCKAGECLFLGARGSQRARGDWEITFSFAASPNVTGLDIGDEDAISKKGWEYLWVRYLQKAVGTGEGKILAPYPTAVYVERLYDDANHALLGIGTT